LIWIDVAIVYFSGARCVSLDSDISATSPNSANSHSQIGVAISRLGTIAQTLTMIGLMTGDGQWIGRL
jgi:hypothetical protein